MALSFLRGPRAKDGLREREKEEEEEEGRVFESREGTGRGMHSLCSPCPGSSYSQSRTAFDPCRTS